MKPGDMIALKPEERIPNLTPNHRVAGLIVTMYTREEQFRAKVLWETGELDDSSLGWLLRFYEVVSETG